MDNAKQVLTDIFQQAIILAFGEEFACDPVIQKSSKLYRADYQANFALKMTAKLKMPPQKIAQIVVENINKNEIISSLTVSGPGFININLTNAWISNCLKSIGANEHLGIGENNNKQKIVVDYGSANVAKEMHVGHIRSLVIGDCLVRVLQYLGHEVVKQNHLGDWGTQFGMLIQYLLDQGINVSGKNSLEDLNSLYKQAKKLYDEVEDFAKRARNRVVLLQQGDALSIEIWQQLVQQSRYHFHLLFSRLGVLLQPEDDRGESFYNSRLRPLVEKLEKNELANISDGATVIPLDGFVDKDNKPLPYLIKKSDGGFLYATTDIAALDYRVNELKSDRVIYVVDARQKQHFAMLFAAFNKIYPKCLATYTHVAFGAILGEDKKPFKTRSGDTIKLTALLDEAEERAKAMLSNKQNELTGDEKEAIVNSIAIGAIKYADLSNELNKDYIFEWDAMLSFDGNTAPYLINAYVRIQSIFRKLSNKEYQFNYEALFIETEAEKELALEILNFAEVVGSVGYYLQPHRLCHYLYNLSATFHRFYETCPVLQAKKDEQKESRLSFCALTSRILKQGLYLLGINVVEKM